MRIIKNEIKRLPSFTESDPFLAKIVTAPIFFYCSHEESLIFI